MLTSYTRLLATTKQTRAMVDGPCVCGHDRDAHAPGGDYCAVPDCCCEGWLALDE